MGVWEKTWLAAEALTAVLAGLPRGGERGLAVSFKTTRQQDYRKRILRGKLEWELYWAWAHSSIQC